MFRLVETVVSAAIAFSRLAADRSPLTRLLRLRSRLVANCTLGWTTGVVVGLALLAACEGPDAPFETRLDDVARARVIDVALLELNRAYVFPDVAKQIERVIRERQARGEYARAQTGVQFAALLTRHLWEVSHDKHLAVKFSSAVIGDMVVGRNDSSNEVNRRRTLASNCHFEAIKILPGKVGYIKVNQFGSVDVCTDIATVAMSQMVDIQAIVFDLRDNIGGDANMGALLSSYLFAEVKQLSGIWVRETDFTGERRTTVDVPENKLVQQPVFVLISAKTLSAAEAFAYDLKSLKRATLVGEVTGGGAHPARAVKLGDHFSMSLPYARAINPITHSNWEGVGVKPDVKVTSRDALATALALTSRTPAGSSVSR